MAVNRFDQPTQVEYISQYTPIPFQELYNLGREYNAKVDQNLDTIGNYIKDWKTFQSPILKDIETYNQTAMNPMVRDVINAAVTNPDALKDPAFRGRIQNAINSVDYTTLRALQQSAQNANNYLKVGRQMAAAGEYNRNWDTFDPTTYSTAAQGIFNDVAPTKFITMRDLVNPYVKDLEPTFYGSKDPITGAIRPFTDWMAVTENEIRGALQSRYNDIIQTPQGMNWYRDIARMTKLQNPNATAEDIDNAFVNALVDASRQYIHSEPRVDNASLAMWRVNEARKAAQTRASRKTSGTEEDVNKPADFTDTAKLSSTQTYNTGTEAFIMDRTRDLVGPAMSRLNYYKANPNSSVFAAASIYDTEQEIENAYSKVRSQDTTPRAQFRYYLDKAAEDNNGNYNLKTLRTGTNNIIEQYSYPITNASLRNAFNVNIPGIAPTAEPIETQYGTGYEMQRTDGLTLAPVEIATRAGININNGVGTKLRQLQDMFDNNQFSYVLLENTNSIMSLPTRSNNNSATLNTQRANVSVRIPMDQLLSKGFTKQDIEDMGGRVHPAYSYTKQTSEDRSVGSERKTIVNVPETVSFDCFSDISQDMMNQEYANFEQNRNRMSTAQAGEYVPDVQWNAYDDFDVFNDIIDYNDYGNN